MENKKEKLFDRVFKPQIITLENGHTVTRYKSRTPLIVLSVVAIVVACILYTRFDIVEIFHSISHVGKMFKKIFHPDWSYLSKVIGPLLDTIKMSLLGSIIGSIVALPLAILASSNINKNRYVLSFVRLIFGIVRTIPTLILATIFALVYGFGTMAGTVAISIFTFGIVGKMLFESIETIDMGPFEAMESLGANKFEAFWTACMPQILPTYLDHCLYCFETNIRAAAILGYVGAGGVGILINERIGWRDYNGLGTVLIILFIAVLTVDQISTRLRRKLS